GFFGGKKTLDKKCSPREKNNLSELSKYDNLLEGFEQLVSIWEANPRTFEADTSTTLIQQHWDMIYTSAISTFVGSVRKWFDDPLAQEKPEYKQIKPLLDKWEVIPGVGYRGVLLPHGMDQQIFEDFKSDVKVFSVDYPKWSGQEWTIIEWFEK